MQREETLREVLTLIRNEPVFEGPMPEYVKTMVAGLTLEEVARVGAKTMQISFIAEIEAMLESPPAMTEKEAWEWMGLYDDSPWERVQSRYYSFVDMYHPTGVDGQEWAPMYKINEAMSVLQRSFDGKSQHNY